VAKQAAVVEQVRQGGAGDDAGGRGGGVVSSAQDIVDQASMSGGYERTRSHRHAQDVVGFPGLRAARLASAVSLCSEVSADAVDTVRA